MLDQYGRRIHYMRVSITDRCNLRCRYCMPDGIRQQPMQELLTYEEMIEVVGAAASLGIDRIKVTGGEPLVRLGCADFIRMCKQVPGIRQVTMTTNGVLLEKYLPALLDAGLDAVNISLDTLDAERYAAITGSDVLDAVLASVDAALKAGLPTKLNVVPQRGFNEDELFSLAELSRERPLDVRFIEMMPIGEGARFEVLSNDVLKNRLMAHYPGMVPDATYHGNGPAAYYKVPGYCASIGFISAIHGKFCHSCNRVRLTAQGRLKPCLCFAQTTDLRSLIRKGRPEERTLRLQEAIGTAIYNKPEAHRFEERGAVTEHHRMIEIGG